MEKAIYLMEQFLVVLSWTLLLGKAFPQSKLDKGLARATHVVGALFGIYLCSTILIEQLTPIMCIGVSSLINVITSKRNSSRVVVESIITFVLIKGTWFIATFVGFLLTNAAGVQRYLLAESLCDMVVHSIFFMIIYSYAIPEKWDILTDKYSLSIVTISSILFLISYGIITVPYIQQRREFNLFTAFVVLSSVAILILWVLGDAQRRKEAEEQKRHIDDLVRSAHKYKEIIPAVERELKEMRRKINAESDHDWASELGVALEEVVALRKGSDQTCALELGKVPGFASTGLALLDRQIQGEQEAAAQAGILFECTVLSPVTTLIETGAITQFQLQQMVGDLYRNGEKAVRDSGEEGGRLLLILGQTETGYQIKLCDSGIPFPKEVLDRLGERGISTDGTGHGLADICETLADCGASLEIQAHEGGAKFRKSVSIVFDGKGEWRV